MNKKLQAVLGVCAVAAAAQASAAITFYQGEGFHGRAVTTDERVGDIDRFGFDRPVHSVTIDRGPWEVCEHEHFQGKCVVLRHGNYPTLRGLGTDGRIASARPYRGRDRRHDDDDDGPRAFAPPPPGYAPPPPAPVYQPQPAFYDVPVTSVHAVVGPPSQRCWVEREQVAHPGGGPNVGGAVLGGLVGGLLGHQVGGGSGKDLATVGGVVAGAAIGANVNRDGTEVQTRDVQRCRSVTNAQPAYYDVAYFYRGVEHHAQMTAPPGTVIRVDAQGAPVVAR